MADTGKQAMNWFKNAGGNVTQLCPHWSVQCVAHFFKVMLHTGQFLTKAFNANKLAQKLPLEIVMCHRRRKIGLVGGAEL